MRLLHLLDLLQPTHVAFPAVEFGTQERADELGGQLRADYLRADAEDIHVVVLDALVRGVGVVAYGRADARELARRNRSAHARAADEDPAHGLAAANRLADFAVLVRIVVLRLGLVLSEVAR